MLRIRRVGSGKQTNDLFEPSYWRVMLLNRLPKLKDAYMKYM